jgi:hypothetical protein
MHTFLDALHVVNLLLLNEIKKHDYAGLLSMLDGLLMNGRKYFGATKRGLMEIVIQNPMVHVKLAKSGIRRVLLSVINVVRAGCSVDAFTEAKKGLVSFTRRIRV